MALLSKAIAVRAALVAALLLIAVVWLWPGGRKEKILIEAALAEQVAMDDGEADGRSTAYYPSGFLKAETQLEHGNIVAQKFWNDGEVQPPSADGTQP